MQEPEGCYPSDNRQRAVEHVEIDLRQLGLVTSCCLGDGIGFRRDLGRRNGELSAVALLDLELAGLVIDSQGEILGAPELDARDSVRAGDGFIRPEAAAPD